MRILLLHGSITAAGMGATAVTAFRQKSDGLRDNFMLAAFLAVLGLPPSLLQPSVHDHTVSLAQILPTVLGLLAEHDNVHKTHFLFQIITLFVPPAHRQSQGGDRGSARCVPQFGIAGEVSDEDDFVKPGHQRTPRTVPQRDAAPVPFRGEP